MSEAKSVLVIDRDKAIREFIFNALKDEGFKVLTAASSRIAHSFLHRSHMSAVVMDLSTTSNDDLVFVNKYRGHFGRHAPLIVMTTNVKTTNVETVRPQAVLAKPFDLTQLISLVCGHGAVSNTTQGVLRQ
jgi:DNA-binding NtrC family response regulator